MKVSAIVCAISALLLVGCSSTKNASKPEKGPGGTIAYLIDVEVSEPGPKIEVNGDYVGEAPCTIKVFGDKDGTFHNFGSGVFTIRALPARPGQYEQIKTFQTGGWFSREDKIPKRVYFEMNLAPAGSGTSSAPAVQPPPGSSSAVVSGTAFAITSDGYLISNFHVVRDAKQVIVAFPDERVEAKVVEKDVRNDLALLKVFKQTTPLPLGDSAMVKMGEELCTLGFPRPGIQGTRIKFDRGSVSSLTGIQDDVAQFQISVPAQPGNSGGPLLNSRGYVVGVLVSGLNPLNTLARESSIPQNVNYAVKVSYLRLLLDTVPDLQGKLPSPKDLAVLPFSDLAERASPSVVLVEASR